MTWDKTSQTPSIILSSVAGYKYPTRECTHPIHMHAGYPIQTYQPSTVYMPLPITRYQILAPNNQQDKKL